MPDSEPSIALVSWNVAAIRSEPHDGAEMVSQGLFGESVAVLRGSGGYARIRTADRYEGWVRSDQIEALAGPHPTASVWHVATLLEPLLSEPDRRSPRRMLLPLGCTVRTCDPPARPLTTVLVANTRAGYVRTSALHRPATVRDARDARNLVDAAARYIGVPYQWGGRSPFGIDCSGLTQMAYRLCGVTIPRDAYLQAAWRWFDHVDRARLAPGDLVFFCGESDPHGRGITHVGLVDDPPRFIHAVGHSGVTWGNLDEAPYRDEFRCARRLGADLRT